MSSFAVAPEHVAEFSKLLQAFLVPDNTIRKQVRRPWQAAHGVRCNDGALFEV